MRLLRWLVLLSVLTLSVPLTAALPPGSILVSDFTSDTVILIDPVGGTQTLLVPTDTLPAMGLALGSKDEIYVSTFGAIHRLDPDTGDLTPVASGGFLIYPIDMVSTSDGKLVVVDRDGASVVEVDPSSGTQSLVSSGGQIDLPHSIAIEPAGSILVANQTGTLIRIDPNTGRQTLLAAGDLFKAPVGVTVRNDGSIFVADENAGTTGAIIEIDPATGAQSMISTGGFFADPQELAFDDNGDLLVLDFSADAVIRVKTATGNQSIVSSGGSLDSSIDIIHVPGGRTGDGAGRIGSPLLLTRAESARDLVLTWGDSCVSSDTDYEVYEGSLGDFTSHGSVVCSTAGLTQHTLTPSSGDRYYLVGASDGSVEGSLGTRSDGGQRPEATVPCKPRALADCP